ncbi:hypothetical protein [Streptomyces sp. NPDC048669]
MDLATQWSSLRSEAARPDVPERSAQAQAQAQAQVQASTICTR